MSKINLVDVVSTSTGSITSEELLPLVYAELRELAAHRIAKEGPNISLQGTALVHEAYLRLIDTDKAQDWDSRGHFFAAASEAMRRILVERARQKKTLKRGGDHQRFDVNLDQVNHATREDEELLALDEALQGLKSNDPQCHQLVMLRYFGGLGHQEAAESMGISRRAADRMWAIARVWLHEQISHT